MKTFIVQDRRTMGASFTKPLLAVFQAYSHILYEKNSEINKELKPSVIFRSNS